jgi:hypothetical protein
VQGWRRMKIEQYRNMSIHLYHLNSSVWSSQSKMQTLGIGDILICNRLDQVYCLAHYTQSVFVYTMMFVYVFVYSSPPQENDKEK